MAIGLFRLFDDFRVIITIEDINKFPSDFKNYNLPFQYQ